MNENLLSIQQAAKLLKVSTKTLRRWEAKGVLTPSRTLGAHRRYTEQQVLEFKANLKNAKKSFYANNTITPSPESAPATPLATPDPIYTPTQPETQIPDNKISEPTTVTETQKQEQPKVQEDKQVYQETISVVQTETPDAVSSPPQPEIIQTHVPDTGIFAKTAPEEYPPPPKEVLTEYPSTKEPQGSFSDFVRPQIKVPHLQADTLMTPLIQSANGIKSLTVIIASSPKGVKVGFASMLLLFLLGSTVALLEKDDKIASFDKNPSVLAATSKALKGFLEVNVPTIFNDTVNINNDLTVDGSTYLNGDVFIRGETLELTSDLIAPNIVYSISAGDGIEVTGDQNLTISNNGVISFQGETGDVELEEGDNVTIDGLKISANVPSVNTFKTISDGTSSFSASGGSDTLSVIAGTGISVSADTTNKKLTITSTGVSTAVFNVEEGDTSVSAVAETLDFLATDFTLGESPSGEINISLDYANSHITRDNQTQAISGDWTFSSDVLLTTLSAGSGSGLCIDGTNTVVTCSGSGVTSIDGLSGAVTIANATGAGSNITIDDASTTQKGIAQFNSTNFSAASGTINTIQNINSTATPTFSGLTLSGLNSAGIVHTNGSGLLSTSALNLAGGATEVSGLLPALNGGTGLNTSASTGVTTISSGTWSVSAQLSALRGGTGIDTSAATGIPTISGGTWSVGSSLATSLGGLGANVTAVGAGELLYSTGTTTYDSLAAGNSGECLTSGGAGAPVWTSCAGATGIVTYWDLINGAVTTKNSTVDLLVGGTSTESAKFAFTGVNGARGTQTASISGNLVLDAASSIQTTNNQMLTIGGSTTGNIVFSPLNGNGTVLSTGNLNLANTKTFQINGTDVLSASTLGNNVVNSSLTSVGTLTSGTWNATAIGSQYGGTGQNFSASTGVPTLNSGTWSVSAQLSALRGGTGIDTSGATGVPSISGGTWSVGANLSTALGGTGQNFGSTAQGSLPYFSASGVMSALAPSTAGWLFSTNGVGANPSWIDPSSLTGTNYFDQNNGAINAKNTTVDFLIGGVSSESAKFAILGVNNARGNQIATLSGSLTLDAAGSLQTTNNQTLTLGGLTTGDITLAPRNGNGSINFDVAATGGLYVNGIAGITDGTAQCVTTTNGLVTGTGVCQLGSEQWVVTNGAIYTGNQSLDLLLGGTSTASAKFAFLNVSGGTPTASISAGLAGALSLKADGSISTTNNQTLTIGGSDTGNITLSPLGGNGTVFSTGNLNLANTKTYQINGTDVLSSTTLGTNVINSSLTSVGTLTSGTWNATAIGSQYGGTGQNFSASTGVPTLNSGTWSVSAQLSALRGGTGIDTSGATGVPSISGGTWSVGATLAPSLGGTGQNFGSSTGVISVSSGTFSALSQLTTALGGLGANVTAAGAGELLYSTGTTTYDSLVAGNSGECLTSGGAGAPVWTSCAGATGIVTYWDQVNGALTAKNSTVDLLVGGTTTSSAKFAVLNVNNGTPTASISAGLAGALFIEADGSIQTTARQSLTLGGGDTGNVVISGFGTGIVKSNASGVLSSSAVDLGSADVIGTLSVDKGGTGVNASTILDGQLLIGNDGANGFTVANLTGGNGITISNGAGVITISQSASGLSKFSQDNALGILTPNNNTLDLLIGGATTTSAKFAFLNTAGARGTQIASISGSLTLDAAGSLQTTNNQTLTIGGSETGNITLSPLGGNGTVLSTGNLNLANTKTYQINGIDVLSATTLGTNIVNSSLTSVGTLTSGTWNATAIGSQYGGTGQNLASSTGVPTLNSGTWSVAAQLSALRGGTGIDTSGATGVPSISGGTWSVGATLAPSLGGTGQNFGSSTGVISVSSGTFSALSQLTTALGGLGANVTAAGAGELLYSTGTTTYDSLAAGNSGECLTSGGAGAPVWTSCEGATGIVTYWDQISGALSAKNSTVDLLVGGTTSTSAKFAILGVNNARGSQTASLSGSITLDAVGSLQTTNNQTLTLGGGTTGDLVIGHSSQNLFFPSYTSNGGLLYTSSTGLLTQLGTGNTGQCLSSNTGAAPSWADCPGSGSGASKWLLADGALSPVIPSVDLLLGSSSSSSARIAFLNVNSGVPTASLSAGLAGGTYITADGQLTTTANQTLTIGGGTTGNIILGQSGRGITLPGFTGQNGVLYGTQTTGALAQITTGVAGLCLVSGASSPTWTDCAASASDDWDVTSGTITPKLSSTLDLLLGGTSTQSAKFAITGINNARGQQTATLSGNLTLDAAGVIQTTNNQTLTIGGSETGNITLSPLGGNGTVFSTGNLNLANTKTYQINGTDVLSATTLGTNVINSSLTSVGTLTSGTWNATAIGSQYGGTGQNFASSTGVPTLNSGTWSVAAQLSALRGGTGIDTSGATGVPSISGGTWSVGATLAPSLGGTGQNFGSSTGVITVSSGTFAASASLATSLGGLGANVTAAGAGELLYSTGTTTYDSLVAGNSGECLTSGGAGAPVWTSCAGATGIVTYWDQANGALSAKNTTVDLLVGGATTSSAKFAFINVNSGTPTASISAGLAGSLLLKADGSIQTTAKQSLTLGGGDTGNITVSGFGTGIVKSNASGVLSSSAVDLGTADVTGTLTVDKGGTGVNASTILDGQILIGNDTANGFTVANITGGNGITVTNGAGSITIAQSALGISKWTQNDSLGILTPNNNTLDLLVGGTTSTSAKFAFLGTASDTPVASISASGGRGIALGYDGTLQTTLNQTLTIGGSTTGNITLSPLGGNGTVLSTGNLNLANSKTYQINGTDVLSATTLGTNVINSSLTSVGTLTSGTWNATAIGSQYGGTGQNFASSTGVPSLSSGTWSVNATLAPSLGGTGQNFGSSTGVITVNAGTFAASATLATSLGGLGANVSAVGAGELLYSTGTTTYDSLAAGNSGECLTSGGAGAPVWTSCAGATGIVTYWDQANGALSAKNSTVDLLIGGTSTEAAKFAVLGVSNARGSQTASISGNLVLDAAGSLQTTNNQSLTIGGNTTGNVLLNSDGNNYVGIGTSAPLSLLDINGTARFTNPSDATDYFTISSGNTSTTLGRTTNGSTLGSVTIDNAGALTADSLVASSQLTLSAFNTNGGLVYTNGSGVFAQLTAGTTGNCLLANTGAAPSWGSCDGVASVNVWDIANGTIRQGNTSLDVLFGGISTEAAKFAFIGNSLSRGNQTASVSGNLVLDAAGSLQTTNNQTLSIGGNTTGNILINSDGFGRVAIGNTSPQAALDVSTSSLLGIPVNNIVFGSIGTAMGTLGYDGSAFNEIRMGATSNVGLQLITNDQVRQYISSTGDVGIGTSTPLAKLDVAGAASVSGNLTLYGGARTIQGTENQTLTVGGGSTGDLYIGRTSQNLFLPNFTTVGGLLYTTSTGLLSQVGTGNTGQCLTGNTGAAPSWGSCDSVASVNTFEFANGTVRTTNQTTDLLVGGLSTGSAKFAILGVNGTRGTQTASLSGSIVLDAEGSLQTTRNQALSIGGNTTGNILINSDGFGRVAIGNQNPQAALDVSTSSLLGIPVNNIIFGSIGTAIGALGYDGSANNEIRIGATSDVGLQLITNDAVRAYISNTGNFGVGTSAPTALLDVAGAASVSGQLTLYGTPTIQSDEFQTLTLGGNTTGNVAINPKAGNGTVFINQTSTSPAVALAIGNDNALTANNLGQISFNPSSASTSASFTRNGAPIALGETGSYIQETNSLPTGTYQSGYASYGNFIYMVGGQDTAATANVYYAKVNADGTVGPWLQTASLPAARYLNRVVVHNGYMYSLGGHNGAGAQSTVYYTRINSDGSLVGWTTTSALGGNRLQGSAVAYDGYIYYMGGGDGSSSALTTTYSAPINPDGSLGTFNTSQALTTARSNGFAVAKDGYVYLAGGHDNTPTVLNTTHVATLNAGTIGSWSATNTIPAARQSMAGVYHNGRMYLLGGSNTNVASGAQTDVYSATLNAGVATWTTVGTSLPSLRFRHMAASSGDYLVTFGGQNNGGSRQSTVYSAPIQTSAFAFNVSTGFNQGNLLNLWNANVSKFAVDYAGNIIASAGAVFKPNVDTTDSLGIATANGTQYVNFDSINQRVGIGTKTPTAKFDVNGTASIGGQLSLYGTPTIQSTGNQTLTLGGDSTGNIVLSPLNGSGTIRFTNFTTSGGILYTNSAGVLAQTGAGNTNECLTSTGGSAPTWTSCTNASTSPFQSANGIITQLQPTQDVLFGGSTTESAKFAFVGNNLSRGNQTASISGNLVLDAAGSLQTTNNQTLTIGGSTTGNISLSPLNGSGTVTVNGNLDAYTGGTATITVAASDSTARERALADYVADGTDDQATIETAIAALPANGGTVFVYAGTYSIGDTGGDGIDILTSNVTLQGAGRGTILQRQGDTASIDGVITVGDGSSTVRDEITIRDLAIDGQDDTYTGLQNVGIYFNQAVRVSRILNNWIYDNDGYGMYIVGSVTGTWDNTISGNDVRDNDQEGIYLDTANTSLISNNTVINNGSANIRMNSTGGNVVEGNYTFGGTGVGIYLVSGGTAVIDGNSVSNSGSEGIYLNGASQTAVTNNKISGAVAESIQVTDNNNTISGNIITGGTWGVLVSGSFNTVSGNTLSSIGADGIWLLTGDSNNVSGNTINEVGASDSGILTSGGSDNNVIVGNRIIDSSGSQYGINISSSTDDNSYLASNLISGAGFSPEVSDSGTASVIQHSDQFAIYNPVVGGLGATLSLIGGGGSGSQVALDLATYDPGANSPGTRILATDDGNFSAHLDFQSKLAGSASNSLLTRMRIENTGSVGIGTESPDGQLHVTRPLSWGVTGKSLVILDQIENQDIFTASASGSTVFTLKLDGTASSSAGFTVNGAGNIQSTNNQTLTVGGGSTGDLVIGRTSQTTYLPGFATNNNSVLYTGASGQLAAATTTNTGYCLKSNGAGAAPSWGTCDAVASVNTFEFANGTVRTTNQTTDLLVGGTASDTAKFAILGVNSGTPTASVSSGLNGTALSFNANGVIQTAKNASLTLGGDTTGNIFVGPRNGTGSILPTIDNSVSLGASSTARFKDLFLGPSSLHVQCTIGDGCGQGLDYALGVNTTSGNLQFSLNGSDNPLFTITQDGQFGVGGQFVDGSTFTVIQESAGQTTYLDLVNNQNFGTSDPFAGIRFQTQDSIGSSWATANDTAENEIFKFAFDHEAGVMYAADDDNDGSIFRCLISSGCDVAGDWSTYTFTHSDIRSFIYDATNNTLYGFSHNGFYLSVARCSTSTSCDASGDWTTYTHPGINQDVGADVEALIFNGSIYVFGSGDANSEMGVAYCSLATNCDADGDWNDYDSNMGANNTGGAAYDTTNGVIYVGTRNFFGDDWNINRCVISTSCDAPADWTIAASITSGADMSSATFNSDDGTIYFGSEQGAIYKCNTSTSCDDDGDWTVYTLTTEVWSLEYVNGDLYAGTGNGGIIYECNQNATGCDAAGDWVISYDSASTEVKDFGYDSTNQVLYSGSNTDGLISRIDLNFNPSNLVYGTIESIATDTTDGAEDGALLFNTTENGTLGEALRLLADKTASFAGNLVMAGGARSIGTTAFNTLTLGTSTTGNIVLSPAGSSALTLMTNGKVGIGTTTPSSQLHVTRSLSLPVTGKALVIFDQLENQDILTASASGVTKFVIKNDGTASSSAGFTINGTGNIQSTNRQTLTLGGSTTGNIVLSPQNSADGSYVLPGADDTVTLGSSALRFKDIFLGPGTLNILCKTDDGCSQDTTYTFGIDTGSGNFEIARGGNNALVIGESGSVEVTGTFRANVSTGDLANSSFDIRAGGTAGGTTAVASVSGSTTFAALAVDNSRGDLFTASSSGLTRFTIHNNGNITAGGTLTGLTGLTSSGTITLSGLSTNYGLIYANNGVLTQVGAGDTGQCLKGNTGSAPTWGTCDGAPSVNIFENANGAIRQGNTTLDFLIGGVSTSSAKFAVLNIAGGTPTASVSAGTNGGMYFAANGTLSTTARQSLIIGNTSTTGDVLLSGGLNNNGTGQGHSVTVSGGSGVFAGGGSGGNVLITGGSGGGVDGLGGSITLNGGTGNVKGSISIGTSDTAALTLGSNSISTSIFGKTGINTDTLLSTLDVRANSTNGGTISVASISGATSKAALVIDNSGSGDILAASSSGLTRFAIQQNGNVLIGTGSATEKLTLAGGNLLHKADGAPTLESSSSTTDANGVFGLGKYAYVADGTSGLKIFDTTTQGSPKLVGSLDTSGTAQGVYAAGVYAYIADMTGGLQIINVSNPLAPQLVSTLSTPSDVWDVVVIGQYAYLAADENFLTVDISNPSSPVIIGTVATLSLAERLYIQGKYAYIADNTSGGLRIIDISNPSNPFIVGSYNTGGTAFDVYVSGRFAYVADGTSGLLILDISNPASPVEIGNLNTPSTGTTEVVVSGNYAYLAEGVSGITVVDITDPTRPSLIGTHDPGRVDSIFVNGKYIFAGGSTSFYIYDINGIDAPAANIGNLNSSIINVSDNGYIGNSLSIGNSLNIGFGGLYSNGTFSFVTASGSGNLIQGAPTGKALLTLNQTGSQDIFTASASGVAKFTITNSGGIRLGTDEGDNGECLLSGGVGSGATWGSCGVGSSSAFDIAYGSIIPSNTTLDLLVGGTSTASAKFAVLNVNNGTPTASVSAGITGALYMTANGTLATTAKQQLSIGNSSTGDILLSTVSRGGSVRINSGVSSGGGDGGAITITGGSPSPSGGNGGAITITGGGSGTSVSDDGGAVTITAGSSVQRDGGSIFINAGSGAANNGAISIGTSNTAALTLGSNSISTSIFGKTGINTDTLLSTLDVRANSTNGGTISVASISGATSKAALVIDNSGSGDILAASSSGLTRFVVKQSGVVQIGNDTNGIVFDYLNEGPRYSGAARPSRNITLIPEYSGAVLTASGSASTVGSMTSDASASAQLSNFTNYYEWSSSATSLNDYTVAVRVKLPADFSGWATATSAAQIKFNTEIDSTNDSKLDVYIYNGTFSGMTAAQAATPVVFRQGQVTTSKVWSNINIAGTLLDSGAANDIDSAGEEVIIMLKMSSKNNNHVQVGDITLNYLSSF